MKSLLFIRDGKFQKWMKKGRIDSLQEIQISELSDVMQNQFAFYGITRRGFHIELENQSLGKVVGKGMINDNLIGWEFRLDHLGFEGFEFYEKGETPDTYLMHAEYSHQRTIFRTVIHGKIWRPLEDQNELEKKIINFFIESLTV